MSNYETATKCNQTPPQVSRTQGEGGTYSHTGAAEQHARRTTSTTASQVKKSGPQQVHKATEDVAQGLQEKLGLHGLDALPLRGANLDGVKSDGGGGTEPGHRTNFLIKWGAPDRRD